MNVWIFALGLFLRRETTAALLRRTLDGERAAGRVLLDRLLPVVHARVWRRLRGVPGLGLDPADLVQETLASLFADDARVLRQYDPARGASPENFVGLVAERMAGRLIEHARAQRRGGGQAGVSLDDAQGAADEAPGAARRVEDQDLVRRFAEHVEATLPERGRLVFRLLYLDEFSPPEVATALNVNLQVVYNWQHRVRTEAARFAAEAAG